MCVKIALLITYCVTIYPDFKSVQSFTGHLFSNKHKYCYICFKNKNLIYASPAANKTNMRPNFFVCLYNSQLQCTLALYRTQPT